MSAKRRTFQVPGPGGSTRSIVLHNTAPKIWRADDGSMFIHYGHSWLGQPGQRYRVEKWGGPHTDRTFQSLQSAVSAWARSAQPLEKKTAAQLDAEIADVLAKPAHATKSDEWAEIDAEYAGTVQSLIDDGYTREDARASAEDNIRETYGEAVVLWRPKHERRAREAQRK